MPLHDTIKQHIKDAMRAKDALKLDVLRGVQSLVGQEMIAKGIAGDTLEDTSLIALIKRAVKQRKDSIEQFTKGGRADLATKEQSELAILESYLPAQASDAAIEAACKNTLETLGITSKADAEKKAGQLVGMTVKALSGNADGNRVKEIVTAYIAKLA
jgi:uncharacterized protein YqeY